MSSAEAILNGVAAALGRIRTIDGYRTDAGLNAVLRSTETIDEEHEVPVFSIYMPNEERKRERGNTTHRDVEGRVLICGWTRPAPVDEIQPLLDLMYDVKRAVFKHGFVPEIEPLVLDFDYIGADFLPRADGRTHAQIVLEGMFKWRESL